MGVKRQKVSSGSAVPARNGVSETTDAESCASVLLAKLAAAEARAEAALNSGAAHANATLVKTVSGVRRGWGYEVRKRLVTQLLHRTSVQRKSLPGPSEIRG